MPSPLKHLHTGETSGEDEDEVGAYERRRGAGISDDGVGERASLAGSEEEIAVDAPVVGADAGAGVRTDGDDDDGADGGGARATAAAADDIHASGFDKEGERRRRRRADTADTPSRAAAAAADAGAGVRMDDDDDDGADGDDPPPAATAAGDLDASGDGKEVSLSAHVSWTGMSVGLTFQLD